MKLFNFTIIKLTVCLIIGILIGYFVPVFQNYAMLITIVLSIILLALFFFTNKPLKRSLGFGLISYITLVSIGLLSVTINNQQRFSLHYYPSEKLAFLEPE